MTQYLSIYLILVQMKGYGSKYNVNLKGAITYLRNAGYLAYHGPIPNDPEKVH